MSDANQEAFNLQLVHALKDKQVMEAFKAIFVQNQEPLVSQVGALTKTVESLKSQLQAKDEQIESLQLCNQKLDVRVDDLEQYTRRASVRFYGIPESTAGSTDDKILGLINTHMELNPQLKMEEIEVSHRVGKPDASGDGLTKPRPIIVKFVSRRCKAAIMRCRKKLRNLHPSTREKRPAADARGADGGDEVLQASAESGAPPTVPPVDFPNPVFIEDDLTQRRAKLAFHARKLRRDRTITDTWVFDTKIMIKNRYGQISEVKSEADLERLQRSN